MFKAIVFDFDGVLVDSEPLHFKAFLAVGASLGVSFDYEQYLEEFVGYDDRDALQLMLQKAGEITPGQRASEQRIHGLCEEKRIAFEQLVEAGIVPIPGAMPLMDDALANLPVAIASGALLSDIDLILRKLGRRDKIDIIVTADQVAKSKPDPESYRLAVERLAEKHGDLGLKPEHCLAIEDTAAGIASARAAGLMTLGLATTGPASTLSEAHRVVESLEPVNVAQLRQWFG